MLTERIVRDDPATRCHMGGCDCHKQNKNVHCPVHNDTSPSLSVSTKDNGRGILLNCHAGCSFDDLLRHFRPRVTPEMAPSRSQGIKKTTSVTWSELKAAKGWNMSERTANSLGIYNSDYYGRPCVEFYYYKNNKHIATRLRIALDGDKFRWKETKPNLALNAALYGQQGGNRSSALLCEGESDVVTVWDAIGSHGEHSAFGLPGVGVWNEEYLCEFFQSYKKIYVWVAPDIGGTKMINNIRNSQLRHKCELVFLNEYKDISDLYQNGVDIIDYMHENAVDWKTYLRLEAMVNRMLPQGKPVAGETNNTDVTKGATFDINSIITRTRN